jgi:hypothetical protein
LDLLVAGIVFVLLFVATYSQRRTWITVGSAALSIALVAAFVFFSTARGASEVHDGLAQLAKALPAGWDRPALEFTTAMAQAATSLAHARQSTIQDEQPTISASAADWFSWGAWFKSTPDAAETAGPDAEPATGTEAATDDGAGINTAAPIKWFLDEPSSAATDAFAVRGANASDQPLKLVRAVLKPDSGAAKLKLQLEVEGHDETKGAVIPPRARFRLKAAGLTGAQAQDLGGAILSVAYELAGRRKTSIMYLTPATLTASE